MTGAGPIGKEVARSCAEPPADGDIDRARLSLNQARPDQRHQAGPIYLSRDNHCRNGRPRGAPIAEYLMEFGVCSWVADSLQIVLFGVACGVGTGAVS